MYNRAVLLMDLDIRVNVAINIGSIAGQVGRAVNFSIGLFLYFTTAMVYVRVRMRIENSQMQCHIMVTQYNLQEHIYFIIWRL